MTEKISEAMQERNLSAISRNGGFKFNSTFFMYTFGEIGPYFLQSGDVMKSGRDYNEAIADMANAAVTIMKSDRWEV